MDEEELAKRMERIRIQNEKILEKRKVHLLKKYLIVILFIFH